MTDDRPIAYLTGDYPKVSHTFILREVQAVRAAGVAVLTCSVRKPAPEAFMGDEERAARAETFYVIEAAKNPLRLLAAHGSAVLRSPGTWAATLAMAIRMRAPGLKALLWQLFYFLEAGVLADHLARNKVRHLHNHFANSSCSVAVLAAKLAGIPFSFTEHGPAIFFEVDRWSLPEKIARAKFVVAITHFCRAQLMLFSKPADWSKIAIVHCGVTPAAYRRAPGGNGKRVAFVGRLDPVKGALLLIEAMAEVLKSHPDATLTLAGDGPARAGAEARAKALGIDGAVRFAGFMTQGQVADLLANSDMLVLPSFAEGLPVVYMEALASRIPVVASRVAGVQELVEDGVTGYAVPPGDLPTLVDRIIRLMDNPNAARDMGLAGRSAVEQGFDIAREGAWLAQLFREGGPEGRLRP
ncbi:MAG: glycosyltransferase [Tabrizicola sp.]|uniref:glycosyltransferase n=1 Tax=Tabrizicola sp. TaxID=2005166 RepID=UPI002AB8EC2B|nr:glycosyltransferase [Tabrizicola sp.]MDZ4089100.1 glycosyltransferase [Tabrizicola sp.]